MRPRFWIYAVETHRVRQRREATYAGRNIDVIGLQPWLLRPGGVLCTSNKGKRVAWSCEAPPLQNGTKKKAVHGMTPCTALGMPAMRGNFVCIQFSTEDSQGEALYCADFVRRRRNNGPSLAENGPWFDSYFGRDILIYGDDFVKRNKGC